MVPELSFQTTVEICNALGQFARARENNDKDVVLSALKIDGRETLTCVRLSGLKWHQKLIRSFGFGSNTLTVVARVLERNEPRLPRCFSQRNREVMNYFYNKDDRAAINSLSKSEFKRLRNDKILGCEAFKRCLANHNTHHRSFKTYILLQEDEKVDLRANPRFPIGFFPEDADALKVSHKYKAPCLDPERFHFLAPFFRKAENVEDSNVLGFCYEYGLGVSQDLNKALSCYARAKKVSVVASYNFARGLLLIGGLQEEAKEVLTSLHKKLTHNRTVADQTIAEVQKTLEKAISEKASDTLIASIREELRSHMRQQEQRKKLLSKVELALLKTGETPSADEKAIVIC